MLRPNPAGKKGYDWTDPSDDEKGQQKTEEKQQKQEKQKKTSEWFHDVSFTSSPAGQDSWQAVAEMVIQFAALSLTWSTPRAPYHIAVI